MAKVRTFDEWDNIVGMALEFESTRQRKTKKDVVSVLEEISRAYRTTLDWPCSSDGFAATEVLLDALRTKVISWKELQLLITHEFDYVIPFLHFCPDLGAQVDASEYEYDGREDFALFIEGHCPNFAAYIQCIKSNCHILSGKHKPSKTLHDPALGHKSAEYWKKYKYHTASHESDAAVAIEYEKKLLKDKRFLKDIDALSKDLNLYDWEYRYHTDNFWSPSMFKRIRGKKLYKFNQGDMDAIREFCDDWCLAFVSWSSVSGSIPKINAQRIRISTDDRTGLAVFIPRFYKFSHIENNNKKKDKNKDFQSLRLAMQHTYDSFRMPAKRVSLETMKAAANKVINEAIESGKSRGEAWDDAFALMKELYGWSESNMIKNMRTRPKK